MLILNLEPEGYSNKARQKLQAVANYCESDAPSDYVCRHASVIIMRIGYEVNEEFFKTFPNVRIIGTNVTGLDHIDLELCENRQVSVISLRSDPVALAKIRASAEYTVALSFALIRQIPQSYGGILRGQRGAWDRYAFKGLLLSELKVGIIGYGRNGQIIGDLLDQLKVDFYWTDITEKQSKQDKARPLNQLLSECNLIMLCIDHNKANIKFFDKEKFNLMPERSFFVNTSRGDLVAEEDLLEALRSGRLTAAATDVISDERAPWRSSLVDHALKFQNLVITPHIAGCCEGSWRETEEIIATKIASILC